MMIHTRDFRTQKEISHCEKWMLRRNVLISHREKERFASRKADRKYLLKQRKKWIPGLAWVAAMQPFRP